MDPRYYQANPNQFRIKSCERAQRIEQDRATDRYNSTAGQLGKIGDLEIWNELGKSGGKVGEGLRTLAKMSNSIRVGTSPIIGGSVDFIFDKLGLNSNAINIAKNLNPGIANRALGQAKVLAESVANGKLKLKDIPSIFQDMQELESLLGGIISPTQGPGASAQSISPPCAASPYATDLFRFAPKYKFLFIVEIEYSAPYATLANSNKIAFVVKTSSRPNVEFEMEEVNKYNFRTKVAKRTIYSDIDMSFYDDDQNQAMQFYTNYMKAMSPIANMYFEQKTNNSDIYEAASMDKSRLNIGRLSQGNIQTHAYSASLGSLQGNAKTVIKQINLYHLYKQGRLMNIYQFYNPRITNLELDDLDMSSSEGNMVNFKFAYDGLFIIPGYQVNPNANVEHNVEGLTSGGLYPISYNGRSVGQDTKDLNSVTGQEMVNSLRGPKESGFNFTNGLSSIYDNGSINFGNVANIPQQIIRNTTQTVIRDAENFTSNVIDTGVNKIFTSANSFAFNNINFGGSDWV